ncbi:MAG: acyl-ACP desaturase [Acidimicrobiia bacterium]|jgi:acyl-[acyl-carrier-protein] desaturase
MAFNEGFELLEAVDGDIRRLLSEHRERRSHWYFHELVPWERGRNFVAEPWDVSQCTISEAARTSLVLNLLTEDNLPYYHSAIERHVPAGSALAEWNHLWTAEEGQHAIALRSYLLVSRNCDPRALEDDRLQVMTTGYELDAQNPSELFAYTAAQELATRVSHRNAGRITDDPVAFELMRSIAADENHHFVFYKGVMEAMLREAPSAMLQGIYRTFANFQMPGAVIPGFVRRSVEIARAGVYNLRIHHDRVIQPLLKQWGIGELTGLDAAAAEYQERLMQLPAQILQRAERFEARFAPTTA